MKRCNTRTTLVMLLHTTVLPLVEVDGNANLGYYNGVDECYEVVAHWLENYDKLCNYCVQSNRRQHYSIHHFIV